MTHARVFAVILWVLAFPAVTGVGAAAAEDGGTVGDMADRLAACSACHGTGGEGRPGNEYNPHLAGKPAGYLFAQLQAFRDGRRSYPQMNWLMRNMDDAFLGRIADYYAGLEPRSSAVALEMAPAAARRAQQLVEQGDVALGVPSCSSCHGTDLAGLAPGVPALRGLPPDYLVAQLGAWRIGVRQSTPPDCMAAIAKALELSDLRPLGEWLASTGVGQSLPPAAAGSFQLPIACGELPVQESPP